MGNGRGCVKRRQNIPQLADMFRVYAARVVLFKKPFQSPMADLSLHRRQALHNRSFVQSTGITRPVFSDSAMLR
jgi:hypothetical protein